MIAVLLALVLAAEPVRRVGEDGAELVLHHREGSGESVLLIHGVSSNARFFDVAPGASLAASLQERGFDVWSLDLPGHGEALRDGRGRRQDPTRSIDDYGQRDLPLAVEYLRRVTGQERIHVVGHSMGGMVLAVYLATEGDRALASAVVLASPLDLREPERVVRILLDAGRLAGPIRRLPTPLGARGLALVRRDLPGTLDALLYNPDLVDPRLEGRMLRTVVSPITTGEIRQLAAMGTDPEFRSRGGEVRWRHALGEVELPMRFLAGRADHVVGPERVRAYYEAVGSTDKDFLVISAVNGFSGDYGHLDYCCARAAAEEVHPLVADWLAAHPVQAP